MWDLELDHGPSLNPRVLRSFGTDFRFNGEKHMDGVEQSPISRNHLFFSWKRRLLPSRQAVTGCPVAHSEFTTSFRNFSARAVWGWLIKVVQVLLMARTTWYDWYVMIRIVYNDSQSHSTALKLLSHASLDIQTPAEVRYLDTQSIPKTPFTSEGI